MRILYDGWALVHHPLSPGSLNLLGILENLPAVVEPFLLLPETAPGWLTNYETQLLPTPDTPYGRLRWEQFVLPNFGRKHGIELLHLTTPTAPVWRGLATLFSPSGFGAGLDDESRGQPPAAKSGHILSRLRRSLGLGGLERLNSVIWPLDLPQPYFPGKVARLPPILPAGFLPAREGQAGGISIRQTPDRRSIELQDLPEDFILYHGPGGRQQLERLAAAWKWATPVIGEYYPLLLIGISGEDQQTVSMLREIYEFGDSLQVLPVVDPAQLSQVYQRGTAVFHPAPASPWCGPVRFALASGKPLVAVEDAFTDAITGPAAYLVAEDDARAFGAALVTVVVEEQVASMLSAAATQRIQGWDHLHYGAQLLEIYRGASANIK